MTNREKRALAAQGMDWRTVEAERIAGRGVVQLDFGGRVLSLEDGQVRLALTDLTPELALAYHTVAAMHLARDGRIPRGKVQLEWKELDRFLQESVGLALEGKVLVVNEQGQVAQLKLEE